MNAIENNILAYLHMIYNIVILGESKTEIITIILTLLESSQRMGLQIHENKIKYMFVT